MLTFVTSNINNKKNNKLFVVVYRVVDKNFQKNILGKWINFEIILEQNIAADIISLETRLIAESND